MSYGLGIDVGTTFTAAAVWRDRAVEVASLSPHGVSVPTVIAVDGEELLYGDAALGRAISTPEAAAREFKRRLGDSVPVFLAGAPYSADRLVAVFAKWVHDTVAAQMGEPAASVVVTHPANWTEFQRHLLGTALEQAGLRGVELISEPQAAAIDFAAAAHVEPGELVLVYDLGGGTFDVALLERTDQGFVYVGEAVGVERLGGIDFDEAMFRHVLTYVPDETLDEARTDPTGRLALAQLRARCVEAKEALSGDVAVDVPVVLPGWTSTARVTRKEFEDMVRPMLRQTVELATQALEQSGAGRDRLSAVLLVGGSSRIPLVADLVGTELSAAVRVDAHPKLVVARGAARRAGARPSTASEPGSTPNRSRRRAVVVGAVTAVALAVGATAWALTSGSSSSDANTSTPGATSGTDETTSSTVKRPDATTEPISTVGQGGGVGPGATSETSVEDAPTESTPGELTAFPTPGDPVPDDTIIFTRLRTDGIRELWSVDLERPVDDPARVQRLSTSGNSTWDNVPAVSRDRRLIAYTSQRAGSFSPSVKAWTGGVKVPTVDGQPLSIGLNGRATWSPDGTQLAYVANRDGSDDLYVYDATSQTEIRLTDDDFSESDPSWSPTSGDILFTAADGSGARELLVVPATGGDVVAITATPEDETDPSWSPDGTRIAFTRQGRVSDAAKQVYVMAADGTGARPLIDPTIEDPAKALGDSDPSWSPDGTRIAFESARDEGIWVVPVDGAAAPEPVARLDGWISVHPAWS